MDPVMINLLIQLGIPIASALLVAGTKKLVPSLPKVMRPIASGFFGLLITALAGATTSSAPGLLAGTMLGFSGVGFREVLDQVKKIGGSNAVKG